MKRAFDLLIAMVLMVLLIVPGLLVACLLRWKQGPQVIYSQRRIGRNGVPFRILKFRTMRPARSGDTTITSGDGDDRISPVGNHLRKFRIDEWPQLWNVLKGDMSLVGPRPEVPEFVDTSDPLWMEALSVRPGITGPDALAYRNEGALLAGAADAAAYYRQEILPGKLALQAQYARERSLLGDLLILFRTLGALRG